jgi:hypothetical protein
MRLSALLLLFASVSVVAQQPATNSNSQPAAGAPEKQSFGHVSGRVFCHDTGEPARFAGVQLLAEKPAKETMPDLAALGKGADFGKLMATALSSALKGSNLSTVTGMDGTFSLEKVPAGTYYVIPQFAGYLSPASGYSQQERMKPNDAMLAAVESAAQKIVVGPDQAINVTVELERGATMSGKVTYDDGSPAAGVTTVLLVQQKDGKWKELGSIGVLPAMTDDLGRFRLSGVQAGQYAVKATLPVAQAMIGIGPGAVSMHMNTGDMLTVYSGGAMREKDVKPIELKTGEQRDDVEVIFPLSGLHTISGSVVAKYDNHTVNAGIVEMEDPDTKAQVRMATIGQDGTFRFNYVPGGTYVLKASGMDMKARNGGAEGSGADFTRMLNGALSGKGIKEYGSAEQTLIVKSDMVGLSMQLPDEESKKEAKGQ